jgi:outer membrane receptor protein involved in Fe transport
MGSVNLSLKPTKWLEFSNRSGIVYNGINNHSFKDEAIYNDYSKSDPWSQGHMGTSSPYKSTSSDQMRNTIILTNDFLATVDQKFGDFTVKAILGNSIYMQKYETIFDAADGGLVIPGLYNISNRIGEASVSQATLERSSIGIFGDATLGYKDFAFLHFSGRNDWDSRLTKANRSFFYPAVDASIILSQMFPSIVDNQVLSFLKVRGGYSQTGQIALNDWYGTLPAYGVGGGFPYGSVAGFAVSTTLSNPLLKPEKTKEVEVGIEMSFLKNRIHLETNYYQSKTLDQTIPANLSSTTGFYSALINAGEMQNKGFEADLKLTPLLKLGKVTWNASVAYSYLTSEVISILPGTLNELGVGEASYAIVGQQFPSIKVTDVLRDPSGNIIVSPITGLPTKQTALVNVGHGNPNHTLGISTDVNYKGFRLSATAEYRGGNVIVNAVGNALDFTGVSEHSAQNGRQPFIIPGSVIESSPGVYTPNTTALIQNTSRPFWVNSDYHNVNRTYTTSAAFWKLREVALSYDVPVKKLFGGNTIQNAQVALIGRNLLMLRPKSNVWTDPEFNNSGATTNAVGYTTEDQTPPTRVYGFSVKLTF